MNTYEKASTPENAPVRQLAAGKAAVQLQDNRPKTILQQKAAEPAVQKKANNTGLPDNLKTGVENLSGYSMDDVKVYYNSDKPAQLQALAYAQGTDIHVAPGQEKHLPHEAWHVVQQKQGRVRPTLQMKGNVNVNDDKGLEKEADMMGGKAIEEKSRVQGESSIYREHISKGIVQRVVHINNLALTGKQRGEALKIIESLNVVGNVQAGEMVMNVSITDGKQILQLMQQDAEIYNFNSIDNLILSLKHIQTQSDLKKAYKRNAQRWYDNPFSEGTFEMKEGDPLFESLAKEILENHRDKPYSTDALHESGSIMGGWMSGDYKRMLMGLIEPETYIGKQLINRPNFKITRIEMYKNLSLLRDFQQAKKEMDIRGKAPNEKQLYSGHGAQGLDFITTHGHDPSYGQYSKLKGHGAHGRGAYFTDRVDKAISYSSSGQNLGEERSFLRQDVLLGNSKDYTVKGTYRDSHHNEMVRNDRNPKNKTVPQGTATEGLDQFDSLIGYGTAESGSSLFGTWLHSKQFDSDEFMVRNADQVYVKFRIYYRLV